MRLKKTEEMNFYEILNVPPSASQQDIEQAYAVGKHAFEEGSLAHYGLVGQEERESTLNRIEEAFKTLSNPRKRRRYDVRTLKIKSDADEDAYFRSTTEKIVIEEVESETKIRFRDKIRRIFRRP
jgi:curved DNA-binding protein CbpA